MINQIDSTIQIVIIAVVIVVVNQVSADFAVQIQRLQQNNDDERVDRRDRREQFSDLDSSDDVAVEIDYERSILKNSKNIDYFDSRRSNDKNTKIIVNIDRHVYYKNVFVFIDRFKNLEKNSFDHRVRELIVECMRDDALIWQTLKLNDIEKNMYRDAIIDQWCKDLIRRFKKRDFQTLKNLQIERYTMSNARTNKTLKAYVQNIMRHVKVVEFNSTYNQLIMIWNNLDFDFKMQISESTMIIILISFFDALNVKVDVWHEMIMIRRFSQHFVDVNVDKRQISKQNQERQSDYQQQFFDVDDFQFSYSYSLYSYSDDWSSFDYTSYQFKNSAYQNQRFQYQFSNAQRAFFVASALSADRQSFQLTFENAFDSKLKNQSSRRQTSEEESNNCEEFDNQNDKTRVYVVDEDEEKKFAESFRDEKDFHEKQKHEKYYTTNENLNYYNSKNYQKNEIFVNFTMIKSFLSRCRRCRKTFSSNNVLHVHLRIECEILNFATKSKFQEIEVYSVKDVSFFSFIKTTKESESMTSISVTIFILIHFNVDFFDDVDFEYDFRDWNYVKAKVSLSSKIMSKNVCLNIDADVSLVDRIFFKIQAFDRYIYSNDDLVVQNSKTKYQSTWDLRVRHMRYSYVRHQRWQDDHISVSSRDSSCR